MNEVQIAELKVHLSEYVRRVRQGETVTVVSRDIPVARLVPVSSADGGLSVRERARGATPLGQVPLPPRLRTQVDVVDLLLRERQGER